MSDFPADVETTTDFRGDEQRANCRECGDELLQGTVDIGEDLCIGCSAKTWTRSERLEARDD